VHPVELPAQAELLGIFLVKFFDLVILSGKSLHHSHAAQILLQIRGQNRALLLVRFVGFGKPFEEDDRYHQDDRNDDDRDQSQT